MNGTTKGKRSHGGAHLPHNKGTAELETVVMPRPQKVTIAMSQHIGVPCTPVVKVGDMVKTGQLIGESDRPVSSPIYASITGKVTAVTEITAANGNAVQAVVITAEGDEQYADTVVKPEVNSYEDFIAAVKKSGLTGLGGAGFPTHIKLSPPNKEAIKYLVINGAECEPYITADNREFLENSENVAKGIELVKTQLNIPEVYIGIESNKPKAIELMNEIYKDRDDVHVVALKARYPQGAEKVLIYETVGEVVPEGKLPADVGAIVMNVASIGFLASYMETGVPLIKKRLTVDGDAVNEPKNIYAPIGTSVGDIIEFCGGYKGEPEKLIMGGPMMGSALPDDSYPITKTTNAVLALAQPKRKAPMTNCIRCGRCVSVCPMNLMPAAIERAYMARDAGTIADLKANLCIQCGTCSYVCPAKRNLVQSINLGKQLVLEQAKKKAGAK